MQAKGAAKGGKYVNITCTDFFSRTIDGGHLSEDPASTNHWNAIYRHFTWTVCLKLAGSVDFVNFIGAAVDISYTLGAGVMAIAMILLALLFRGIGVCVCLIGTPLCAKEKLFCVISYLPKATVQAAIGSVPLAMGLPCGQIVLSVAVLAILITAPLGALGMDLTYQKLLTKDMDKTHS